MERDKEEQELFRFCSFHLSAVLGIPATEDIARYILSFESKRDLEQYLKELLGEEAKRKHAREFMKELLVRWKPPKSTATGEKLYKKPEEDTLVLLGGAADKATKNRPKDNDDADITATEMKVPRKMVVKTGGSSFVDKTQLFEGEIGNTKEQKNCNFQKKKAPKFVSLYTAEGKAKAEEIMLVPGRHSCECLGQKHKLLNNCLECGRIICSQEGSGPCLFCGNLVCSREEQEILARNSKKSAKLYEKLMKQGTKENIPEDEKMRKGLEKAVAHKERLLDYDKTSVRRTKVIDDESDYFATDSRWLSKKDRERLKKREDELYDKKHESRLNKKYTLDFAGRKVVEEENDVSMYSEEDEIVKSVMYRNSEDPHKKLSEVNTVSLVDPRIKIQPPEFTGQKRSTTKRSDSGFDVKTKQRKNLRIQDKEFQEMADSGMCLSMHQPMASLLVLGIKRVEGRSWYTAHRGRLWIAATARRPEEEDIRSVENLYKHIYAGESIPFPKEYPSGVLLGCVDVVDCLSNEEYKEMLPGDLEETSSQHIFICENPQRLLVKFPVKGKHKIWKLDSHIHAAAKKSVERS